MERSSYLLCIATLIGLTFVTEQEELLREMTEKASQPTPEVYMLQKELEKVRSKLRQEQVLGDHEKIQSTNRIHEELDRNKDMVRRFEEQTLQQREMNREMSDLRQQLFHFKQGKQAYLIVFMVALKIMCNVAVFSLFPPLQIHGVIADLLIRRTIALYFSFQP